jgi:hypothetical protein
MQRFIFRPNLINFETEYNILLGVLDPPTPHIYAPDLKPANFTQPTNSGTHNRPLFTCRPPLDPYYLFTCDQCLVVAKKFVAQKSSSKKTLMWAIPVGIVFVVLLGALAYFMVKSRRLQRSFYHLVRSDSFDQGVTYHNAGKKTSKVNLR